MTSSRCQWAAEGSSRLPMVEGEFVDCGPPVGFTFFAQFGPDQMVVRLCVLIYTYGLFSLMPAVFFNLFIRIGANVLPYMTLLILYFR